jgi:hypothetical protein
MNMKKLKPYLSIPIVLLFFWSCDSPVDMTKENSNDTIEPHATAKPGATDEEAGNNLSFPVIWSDGEGAMLSLRGTYGAPVFDGSSFTLNGVEGDIYEQQHPNNLWQAESDTAVVGDPLNVSYVDWGDNLEARSWPVGAQVRVETVLYKTGVNMLAFNMFNGTPDVKGPTEVWGTNTTTYSSDEATIYSGSARLIIQKLDNDREDYENGSALATWNGNQWVGDVSDPLFNSGVWNTTEGPGGYSAEINVQGKVLYGYNWSTRDKTVYEPGDYRITFMLDHSSGFDNTNFDGSTYVLPREEGEVEVTQEPDLEGGVTYIDPSNNITYIDVRLSNEKGNKGGGQGIGKGGKGGGKGHGRDEN